jgi:hypothetical protein
MKFKPGDRIAYSAAFCRDIGAMAGDIPHRRGVYVGERASLPASMRHKFVEVQWDDDSDPSLILAANLAKVGPNMRYCAC